MAELHPVAPGDVFTSVCDGAEPGLVGDINVHIEDDSDTIVFGPSTADIVESGTGIYTCDALVAPDDAGTYLVIWNDGTDDANEPDVLTVTASAAASYTTPSAVRGVLNVDETVLDDTAATTLILDAEDLVDGMLGLWELDETSGRKIVQTDVRAFQWTKLGRATALVAANLYRNPGALSQTQWDEVKGPDFWFKGRLDGGALSGVITSQVIAILNASRLRRMSIRGRPGFRSSTGRPPWYSFSYNDEYET